MGTSVHSPRRRTSPTALPLLKYNRAALNSDKFTALLLIYSGAARSIDEVKIDIIYRGHLRQANSIVL